MGRLNTFEIFLSHQYGQVDAGSVLHGQVVLECSDDMDIREITVHCFGKCRVQWVDARAAAPLAEVQAGISPPVTAEEIYINECFNCLPKLEDGQSEHTATVTRLTKGMHTFNFEFQIPASTPASFTADHGFIKYILRAQVHLPNRVESNVRSFIVCPVFDLNRVSNVEEAVEKTDEVEINSLMRNMGKCRVKLALPKRGFIHGDTIPISLMINNESNKEISKARLRLRMVTKYNIKSQTCTGDRILAESRLAPITAGYTFNSCDRFLRIPTDVPASHLNGCKFMNVKYYVEFYMRPSLLSTKKLRMYIKIHIGTIPISVDREQAYLRMREAPPSYEDLPPSYGDAIRLNLTELQHNATPDQNSFVELETSPSTRLLSCSSTTDCQCQNSYHKSGATCSSSSYEFGACSNMEDVCQCTHSDINCKCGATCSNMDHDCQCTHSDINCKCGDTHFNMEHDCQCTHSDINCKCGDTHSNMEHDCQCTHSDINCKCGATCSNGDSLEGATHSDSNHSDLDSIFSSLNSLIFMDEAKPENVKLLQGSQIQSSCHQFSQMTSGHLPNPNCTDNLRIVVLSRNLARPMEEIPMVTDGDSTDSIGSTTSAKSKRSFTAILHSLFLAFPFLVCQDVR